MRTKRTINARLIAEDIRSGMADPELMDKYGLSAQGLQGVFKKLVDAGIFTVEQLEQRVPFSALTADLAEVRKLPRNYMVFHIPVYDEVTDQLFGHILDLTEKGLKVIGKKVNVGSTRTMLVQPTDTVDFHSFNFEATCRWVGREDDGRYPSGHTITKISRHSLKELQKLIELNAFTRADW